MSLNLLSVYNDTYEWHINKTTQALNTSDNMNYLSLKRITSQKKIQPDNGKF